MQFESRGLLNPLLALSGGFKSICKILGFMHHLALKKLHNPEITFSDDSFYIEARWFTRMMAS